VKKKLHFIAPLLFICAFSTCKAPEDDKKKDDKPPPLLLLDQRLVGGRWYYTSPSNYEKPAVGADYLEFFIDNRMSYICTGNHEFDKLNIPVYSIGGVVYNRANGNWILEYGFNNKFPYRDLTMYSHSLNYLDQLAASNNLIVCPKAESLVNNVFPSLEDTRRQFLIRFHEDETPYR